MGINVFLVTSELDELEDIVERVNNDFGYGEIDAEDPPGIFSWCDIFRGEGGHVLTFDEALSFEDAAQPWYIITDKPGSLEWLLISTVPDEGKDWRSELEKLRDDGYAVVFLKART